MPLPDTDGSGIIRVHGSDSIFNTSAPMDPRVLQKVLTETEFSALIDSVNDAVARAVVGLPRFASTEMLAHRARSADAAHFRVSQINEQWQARGLFVKYHQGMEHSEFVRRRARRHYQETTLYIRLTPPSGSSGTMSTATASASTSTVTMILPVPSAPLTVTAGTYIAYAPPVSSATSAVTTEAA